jgi:lipopolysaccharide transport protein LptA
MANSILKFSFSLALCLAAWIAAAAEDVENGDRLPILLDAESSSFDQQSNTVVFRGLNITQGELGVRADEAVASGLDFTRSEWQFTGSVEISIGSAVIEAESASIIFAEHALQSAELRGTPAEFQNDGGTRETLIRGGANVLRFDNVAQTLQMSEGAWLSEGANEFTGCDLIYDFAEEKITSGSSGCGESVVITITPPASGNDTESAPLQ